MSEDKRISFNIFYLNFSKVYEISMTINNIVVSSVQRENSISREKYKKSSIKGEASAQYLAGVKAIVNSETGEKSTSSSKVIETLDVKTTKSILLRNIIKKCKTVSYPQDCQEGSLLKIDNIELRILNDENLRQMLILRKDALKGMHIEGLDFGNLISSVMQDYSYLLIGEMKNNENIILKIPMKIENEFESEYNVFDLLIGHVSIIGIYRGTVSEELINSNTFDYLVNLGSQTKTESKVISSAETEQKKVISLGQRMMSKSKTYHFIDIIAIIQDIHLDEKITNKKISWIRKLINRLFNRGTKK